MFIVSNSLNYYILGYCLLTYNNLKCDCDISFEQKCIVYMFGYEVE